MADIPNPPHSNPVDVVKRVPRAIGRLPPWVIFAAVGTAVLLGLYIRHRNKQAYEVQTLAADGSDSTYDVNQGAYDPSAYTPDLSGYTGGGGGAYPVSLGGDYSGLITAPPLPSPVGAPNPPMDGAPADPGSTLVINLTGGGPPTRPAPAVRTSAPARPQGPADPPGMTAFLDQAEAAHQQMFGSKFPRDQLAARKRAHPDWGPHTVANNGKARGHSVAW